MYHPLVALQRMADELGDPGVEEESGQVPSAHIQHVQMQSVQTQLDRITSLRLETASEQALDRQVQEKKQIEPDTVFLIAQK
ncbi:unnamed protein product [Rotaria sordida]|uniref:Uncharacterized protein n=1 Tax=Rotaria sordida TaxID=392033 RepID=A0A819QE22_9BILA|nr:unnamed protein product [Rotaria sordida]CAF4030125.1 unnamed protein product [Rotaria sordida]